MTFRIQRFYFFSAPFASSSNETTFDFCNEYRTKENRFKFNQRENDTSSLIFAEPLLAYLVCTLIYAYRFRLALFANFLVFLSFVYFVYCFRKYCTAISCVFGFPRAK